MVSRLHLLHHNYLIYYVTVLLGVAPLYATIQEYFFKQTGDQVVRRLDHQTYHLLFWKTKGGAWFHRDTSMILELYYSRHRILWHRFALSLCVIPHLVALVVFKQRRKTFSPPGT